MGVPEQTAIPAQQQQTTGITSQDLSIGPADAPPRYESEKNQSAVASVPAVNAGTPGQPRTDDPARCVELRMSKGYN